MSENNIEFVKTILSNFFISSNDCYQEHHKAHRVTCYASKKHIEVLPKKMSTIRSIVRHLSTFILFGKKNELGEIQAAISTTEDKIYISSNRGITYLRENFNNNELSSIKKLKPNKVDERFKREFRHITKLMEEIQKFKAYKIVVLPYGKINIGQHAEINILKGLGKEYFNENIDYIGGTKRPCLACFLIFKLDDINTSKYNPHYGAYWNSKGALNPLVKYEKEIITKLLIKEALDLGYFFVNVNYSKSEECAYDTDSE